MKPRSFNAGKWEKESGQAVFLIVLSIPVFLLLMGLAIDAGYLYLMRSKLQRAVDAATISGIDLVSRGFADSEVRDRAVEMGTLNAVSAGIPESKITQFDVTVETDPATRITTVAATASFDANVLLLRLLPGLVTKQVRADAAAERIPALISLVLDVSESMNDCSSAGCSRNKLDDLKEAAKIFVAQFLSQKDQMALVTFDHFGAVAHPMQDLDIGTLQGVIDGLSLREQAETNPSEGIVLGRLEIERALGAITANGGNPDNYAKALILFSDGAPNVMRADFFNPRVNCAAGPGCEFPRTDATKHDYYLYFDTGGERFFPSGDPRNHYRDAPLCTTDITCKPGCSIDGTCGSAEDCPCPFSMTVCWPPHRGVNNCVSNLGYDDSRRNSRGESIIDADGGQYPDAIHELYHLTIVESDYARESDNNITVYTVGLGEAATRCTGSEACCTDPNNCNCGGLGCDYYPGDPYQNISAPHSDDLKEIFLRRIANDPKAKELNDPKFPGLGWDTIPQNRPKGLLLTTPNSTELKDLFLQIAQKIKQRMTR